MSTTPQTPQVKHAPWSAEQLCINSISILGSDGETELASIIGEDKVGEEEWSRARLMAAAPDMIAALKAIKEHFLGDRDSTNCVGCAGIAADMVNAAIAKAERGQ